MNRRPGSSLEITAVDLRVRCAVCGDGLAARLVAQCPACLAAVHSDCALMLERCATYGCRVGPWGTLPAPRLRAVRTGAAPNQPVPVDGEDWPLVTYLAGTAVRALTLLTALWLAVGHPRPGAVEPLVALALAVYCASWASRSWHPAILTRQAGCGWGEYLGRGAFEIGLMVVASLVALPLACLGLVLSFRGAHRRLAEWAWSPLETTWRAVAEASWS